ncbi:MAG: restriction endonuclease subunit S, partial [Candidatus Roizmanbacteria bacterium]|nr:restriction endonuclease subunit S [Candidatus Roizmanbacteria bacterium]
ASTFLNHRAMISREGYVSNHLATIIANEKEALPEYLFYILCRIDAKKLTPDQAYPSLKTSEIAKIKIPLPPLEIQKEIVKKIEDKQTIINNAKELISNLERERTNSREVFEQLKCDWVEFEKAIDEIKYTRKIQKSQFLESGKYPIVDQSEEFISGYWNEEADLFKVKKPIIIFGDHTRILKYIDFDFVLGADGVKILQPIDELLGKYLYYFLLNKGIKNLGYSRHYKELKEISVPIPDIEIQKQLIARFDKQEEAIRANKTLIEVMQESINEKINEVWSEDGQ